MTSVLSVRRVPAYCVAGACCAALPRAARLPHFANPMPASMLPAWPIVILSTTRALLLPNGYYALTGSMGGLSDEPHSEGISLFLADIGYMCRAHLPVPASQLGSRVEPCAVDRGLAAVISVSR